MLKKYEDATRRQAMLAAHALKDKFKAKNSDIAKVLDVHPSTISSLVKEMRYQREINDLQSEIDNINEYVTDLHNKIEYNVIENYEE